ncbi:MGMT family protein [Sporosarcina trichiuri]|uniref:MGMT family protein n=1 Tax=Sporosarcina trichiuri TaxID=3056445 RepID=UPI0025B2C4C2|nr:MGMT family protein [Sporosarcina sp. 0.2-SM1T-5]WJY26948.1 MGMT family protein [Sporosarcina sp. 0.2-SM1T-5]
MNPFTEKAVRTIQSIPEGHVMTYGQVAAAAGNRRGARQVVRILHSMSVSHRLPWHRIINAKGGISAPADAEEKGIRQKRLLLSEGVVFREDGTVDLERYRWFPPDASME